MKALVILFDGSTLANHIVDDILSQIGVESNSKHVHANALSDVEVADSLIKQIHIPEATIIRPKEIDPKEEALLLQTKAFCKDIINTLGKPEISTDYKRKFISFLITNENVLESDVVKSLKKPSKLQKDILEKYGLQHATLWIKLATDLFNRLGI